MIDLTIITITYNAEKYIGRTLLSLEKALANKSDSFRVEYLVIDGASKDTTLLQVQKADVQANLISEPDKGLYDAMNKGLAIAKGKYVWFMNAGDTVYSATILQELERLFKSDADIFYSDAIFVREDGSEIGLRSQVTPHTLPHSLKWQDMALGMKVCHQAFIVKRKLAPAYQVQNLSADLDWEIACLKQANKVIFISTPLCTYLIGGLSVQNHKKSLVDRWKVLQYHFGTFSAAWNHLRIMTRGVLFLLRNGKYW